MPKRVVCILGIVDFLAGYSGHASTIVFMSQGRPLAKAAVLLKWAFARRGASTYTTATAVD